MKKGLASLYYNNDWGLGTPFVYNNGSWKKTEAYIYTGGQWKKACAAGGNMVYFLVNNGDYLVDSSGAYVLVRAT